VQPSPTNAGNPLASAPAPPFGPEPLEPATLSENVVVGFVPLEQPDSTPPAPAKLLPYPGGVVPLAVVEDVNPGTTSPAAVTTGSGPSAASPPGNG